MTENDARNKTKPIEWFTLIGVFIGIIISGWNAWITNANQMQKAEMTHAISILQHPIADKMNVDPNKWAKIVFEQQLAEKQNKTDFQRWADLYGKNKAFKEMMRNYCFRPHRRFVIKSRPVPTLEGEGDISVQELLEYSIKLKYEYLKLAALHDALVGSVTDGCKAANKMAK